jgi:hypothetical protein
MRAEHSAITSIYRLIMINRCDFTWQEEIQQIKILSLAEPKTGAVKLAQEALEAGRRVMEGRLGSA